MKIYLTQFVFLFLSFTSIAQVSSTYHQNQLLLNLKGMSQEEITELIVEFEVEELWISPLSETRCWSFSSFPEVHEIVLDGETVFIYDIIQAAELVKSRNSGGTAGVSISVNPSPKYEIQEVGFSTQLFNPNLFIESGENEVVLSILDSGSTRNVDDSDGYAYNPNINTVENYIDGSPSHDENSHGTHILGIANHIGTTTSPFENVITIDVRKILNIDNKGDLGSYILAIEEAIVDGAQILNLSLSFPEVANNQFVNILVELLESHNILGVVAAGNDGLDLSGEIVSSVFLGENIFPAALQSPNLITVASYASERPTLSSFSNYGINNVDVAVPGEQVAGYNIDSEFLGMSGTSQAAAIVSGVAANLGTHQPIFDGAAIKCAIVNSVDPIEELIGLIVSEGLVNAQSALTYLQGHTGCPDNGGGRIELTSASLSKVEDFIYPNPFSTSLNIELIGGANEIVISDILGNVIYSIDVNAPADGMLYNTDKVATLNTGVYVINVNNKLEGSRKMMKLVKN